MKQLVAVLFAALTLVAWPASAASLSPLVTPAELAELQEQAGVVVLDIRGDAYEGGYIPGAVSAPYGLFRGPDDNPGQLLDAKTLEERYEALGLELDQTIVIVAQGETDTDFGAAARVYWTLKSTGFEQLSILNGGFLAWEAAELPIEAQASTLPATDLDIAFSDEWTAETEAVVAATRGEIDALLLDARPDDFYLGRASHPAAAKPGTLPGAKQHTYTKFFDEGSSAIDETADKNSLMEQLGVEQGDEIVSFCNTGHWAATNWFALSEVAGIENVKLYPGSMVEYSNAGLEMENTPGLIDNFVNKLRGN